MADLQKQLDVAAQVVHTPVAPPSSAPGDIVRAFGAVAEVIHDKRAANEGKRLEENLTQLGREAFAAKTGGPLDSTSERFAQLKAAQEQGVLTETFVRIEAEKILKESINKFPGYKDQLRQQAADLVGFDPTGAHVKALYGALQPARSGRQSYAEKKMEEYQHISNFSGIPIETIAKLDTQASAAKLQADLVAQQAALGAYGSREIFNSTLKEGETYKIQLFRDVVQQVNAGGVRSPEQVQANVQTYIMAQKQALRDRVSMSGHQPSATEMADYMAQIDRDWQPIVELAKSGSMDEILSTQANSIGNAMTIEGWNTMGHLALINKMHGQEGVKNYHLTIDKYGKEGELELLKRGDSFLAQHLNSIDALKKGSRRAYNKVMGIPMAEANLTADEEDVVNALVPRVLKDNLLLPTVTEEEKQSRLQAAKEHGQKYKVLSAYMQRGGRENASEEEVQFVTQTFHEEVPQLIERIALDMALAKGTPQEYSLAYRDGKLVKTYTPSVSRASANMSPGFLGVDAGQMVGVPGQVVPSGGRYTDPVTTADLQRLEFFSQGLANGWGEDVGVRPLTFIGDTLAKIDQLSKQSHDNQGELEDAISAYEASPTPELWERVRSLDPDFASQVERAAGRRAPTGGDSE